MLGSVVFLGVDLNDVNQEKQDCSSEFYWEKQ